MMMLLQKLEMKNGNNFIKNRLNLEEIDPISCQNSIKHTNNKAIATDYEYEAGNEEEESS